MNRKTLFILTLLTFVGGPVLISSLALLPSDIEIEDITKSNSKKIIQIDIPEKKILDPDPVIQKSALLEFAPESIAIDSSLANSAYGKAFGPGVGDGMSVTESNLTQAVQNSMDENRSPKVVSRGPLDYPVSAKASGVEGFVLVKVLVAENGSVQDVQLVESEPKGFFEESALRSIRQWRFDPGMKNGKTMALWSSQKIVFSLEE